VSLLLPEFHKIYPISLSEMVYINSIQFRQFLSQDDYSLKYGHMKCSAKWLKVIRIVYFIANIFVGI